MAERVRRLEANVLLYGLVHEPAREARAGSRETNLLTYEQWDDADASDDEDLALAVACVRAEFERRERQWAALEFLDFVRHAPDASPPDGSEPELAQSSTPASGGDLIVVPRTEAIALAETVIGWDHKLPT